MVRIHCAAVVMATNTAWQLVKVVTSAGFRCQYYTKTNSDDNHKNSKLIYIAPFAVRYRSALSTNH